MTSLTLFGPFWKKFSQNVKNRKTFTNFKRITTECKKKCYGYYKVRQSLSQSVTGIIKCGRKLLQSGTGITKCGQLLQSEI